MNEQERKIITDNMDLLIQQTNDKDLALELWQSDVISQTTYDSIVSKFLTSYFKSMNFVYMLHSSHKPTFKIYTCV